MLIFKAELLEKKKVNQIRNPKPKLQVHIHLTNPREVKSNDSHS